MPEIHSFDLSSQELNPIVTAQRLLRETLGGAEIPVDILVSAAVRATDPRDLADGIIATLAQNAARTLRPN